MTTWQRVTRARVGRPLSVGPAMKDGNAHERGAHILPSQAACDNSKLAGQTVGRRTGASRQSPNLSLVASPDETEEVFGRGILRIQSHGSRHAYFITFFPDVAHCYTIPLSPETLRGSSQDSNIDSRTLSKPHQSAYRDLSNRIRYSSVTEMEDKGVQSSRHWIQQNGTAQSEHNKQSRAASRKGMPWPREEEDLLKTLREDRNIPWSEVARCFTKQFPGRSQGSMRCTGALTSG